MPLYKQNGKLVQNQKIKNKKAGEILRSNSAFVQEVQKHFNQSYKGRRVTSTGINKSEGIAKTFLIDQNGNSYTVICDNGTTTYHNFSGDLITIRNKILEEFEKS